MKQERAFHTLLNLYPCRCLCFGVRLQMTNTRPFRRTTRQYAQIGFTDALTFTVSKLLKNNGRHSQKKNQNQISAHCLAKKRSRQKPTFFIE